MSVKPSGNYFVSKGYSVLSIIDVSGPTNAKIIILFMLPQKSRRHESKTVYPKFFIDIKQINPYI